MLKSAFTEQAFSGGSEHMVASLVTFDAPIHMKYRKLTQDWFMPRNLRAIEDEVRGIARQSVDRLFADAAEDGTVDFCKAVAAPYPLGGDIALDGYARKYLPIRGLPVLRDTMANCTSWMWNEWLNVSVFWMCHQSIVTTSPDASAGSSDVDSAGSSAGT